MSSITERIELKTASLQKKIEALSGNYLTNTWKRQQEQKRRDRQIENYRLQKQVLEYLVEELSTRELTLLEKTLITAAFYEDMRSLLARRQYDKEHPSAYPVSFPTRDEAKAKRLRKAGIQNTKELYTALTQFAELISCATVPENPKVVQIRDMTYQARLHQGGDIQFTPKSLVKLLIQLGEIQENSRVLEPEAGIGYIADEIKQITPHVDCIEISGSFRELLELKGHHLVGCDLLECKPEPVYDAVLMNPPFSNDSRHIRHAFGFLKQGGRLVTVCLDRLQHSEQKKYQEFQDWLRLHSFFFHETDEKFEMTGARVRLLVIQKAA